ncbi:MAG: hypothetical protein ACP5L5_04600 [Vulcanisaeta sp.]|uniref:hypothetical protein n=1 Tax=Vulcanisaeta sp. TaxID=2020871 RepID=UPI003D0EF9DA
MTRKLINNKYIITTTAQKFKFMLINETINALREPTRIRRTTTRKLMISMLTLLKQT